MPRKGFSPLLAPVITMGAVLSGCAVILSVLYVNGPSWGARSVRTQDVAAVGVDPSPSPSPTGVVGAGSDGTVTVPMSTPSAGAPFPAATPSRALSAPAPGTSQAAPAPAATVPGAGTVLSPTSSALSWLSVPQSSSSLPVDGSLATSPATAATASTGWHSGASGRAAQNGSFGTWRGKAIQATAIWGDTSAQEQSTISSLGELSGFDGDVDVAVGGLADGETWARAATGAYANRWRQAARAIAAARSGKPGRTYVRFAHEMNGDWYTWRVTGANLADFRTSWRLFHDILAQEFPAAQLVFSPNNDNHSDITVSQIYPGDDVVDVIGVDFYDGWPSAVDAAVWNQVADKADGDQPVGPRSWQRFAAAHGKPLSFPEWGLQFGDHPAFIQGMHDFLAANAAQPGASAAGKVVYDVYFDIAHGGNTGFMLTGSANPQSAALYRSLTWGA